MINYEHIESFKGAEYNPRIIDSKQFEELKNSLHTLGIIIPVIVNNANNTIIAGHQRTKACKALGISEIPVIRVEDISIADEIKLNQLHNAVDTEPTHMPSIKTKLSHGYNIVNYGEFNCHEWYPVYIREICQLLIKYGNILSCVVSNGQVLLGGNYVKACQLLRYNVNTYVLEDELHNTALGYLHQSYGKYTYENTEKNTYIQGLAQLHRNPKRTDGKKAFKSQLYELKVIPYLKENPKVSVLDFGCGRGAYVDMLAEEGYDIIGLEFFNNNGQTLDISKGHELIDSFISKVKEIGKFDVIVCDSVLNSVDSHEAETYILSCLNLFLKDGGKLFISGRSYKYMLKDTMCKYDITTSKRFIEFVDERGLTSNFRKGHWYYQKYHTTEELNRNLALAGFKVHTEKWSRVFHVMATKEKSLPLDLYEDAIRFEFNLPLPEGKSFERHNDILQLFKINIEEC